MKERNFVSRIQMTGLKPYNSMAKFTYYAFRFYQSIKTCFLFLIQKFML